MRHAQQRPQKEGDKAGGGGFVVEHRAGQAKPGNEGHNGGCAEGKQPNPLPSPPPLKGRE